MKQFYKNTKYDSFIKYSIPTGMLLGMLAIIKAPLFAMEWVQDHLLTNDKPEFNSVFGSQDIDELLLEKRQRKNASVAPCNGTAGNDNIEIGVTCDTVFALGGSDYIYGTTSGPFLIDAGAGDDELYSIYTSYNGSISLGSGDDFMLIYAYGYYSDFVDIDINTGTGNDFVHLLGENANFNVTSSDFLYLRHEVRYGDSDSLTLNLSDSSEALRFIDYDYGYTRVDANNSGGNDYWDFNIFGDLSFNGNLGNDSVNIDMYIYDDDFQNSNLNLQNGNNVFEFDGRYADLRNNNISFGDGNNYLDLSWSYWSWSEQNNQSFNFGDGDNTVYFYGRRLTLEGQNLMNFGNGDNRLDLFAYSSYGDLEINTGDGNNTFDMYFRRGTNALFTIQTGSGNDTVDVDIDDDNYDPVLMYLGDGNNQVNFYSGGMYDDVFISTGTGNDNISFEVDDFDASFAILSGAGNDKVEAMLWSADDDGNSAYIGLGSGNDSLYTFFDQIGGYIYGGSGNDVMEIYFYNNYNYTYIYGYGGVYTPTEKLLVFGDAGNDRITLFPYSDVGTTLNGGAGNDFLQGSNNDDVLIAGFGADSLLGKGGDDKLYISDSLFAFADGGSGIDELHTSISLDLGTTEGKIKAMERIVLDGTSFQTISITPSSVIAATKGLNGLTFTPFTLVIDGKDKDFVAMGTEFLETKKGTIDSANYTVYRNSSSGATVWIASNLRVGETPPLGVDNAITTADIKISPNPSSGIIQIGIVNETSFKSLQINVLDISGKQVYSQTWDVNSNEVNRSLELPNNLVNGLYFVKVSSETFNIGKTIVLEK